MISRLVLTDFRNHAATTVESGAGFVVFTGENGAGKTNVLEAVSMLAPGRGLRRARLSEMARQGGPGGFGVAATLEEGIAIGTGTLGSAPERRIVRVNGAPAPATSLSDWTSVLWLTPAMDRLFVASSSDRRRFLDRLTLAIAPAHAHHAARYEAAMRARNRLLGDDRPADPEWLAALEAAMAEHGVEIDRARRDLVEALDARIASEPEADFARAHLAIEGWGATSGGDFARALLDGRRRDAAAGRALDGPHRSDLSVVHVAKRQAAALASTGEQKALLFGIVLAHAGLVAERTARAPILLLDEVAAHLDARRRAALFERLGEGGQTWMTGTDVELFDAVRGAATWLTVGAGGVTRQVG